MARGEATETSDVDLIVEFYPNRITLPTFLDFTDDLEALLGRRVDVVSLKKLTPRLLAQVEAEAVRVAWSAGRPRADRHLRQTGARLH